VENIKGRRWARTTLTSDDDTVVFWQTVDDKLNHYTVTFAAQDISRYRRVFEHVMKSFTIGR
jgi:hypothetical protein